MGYTFWMPKAVEPGARDDDAFGRIPTDLETAALLTRAVSHALAALLRACGAHRRGVDIERTLGVDRSLSWHLASALAADHPAEVLEHLPGKEGLEIVLKAAGRAGAPPALVDALRSASKALQDFQSRTAPDRQAMISMLSELPGAGVPTLRAAEKARKAAFKANTAIFGVRAAVHVHIDAVWPVADGRSLGLATMHGWRGLVRLRPGTFIRLGASKAQNAAGSGPMAKPLDPEAAGALHGLPVMSAFSTPHIPAFVAEPDRAGDRAVFLAGEGFGLSTATDLTVGESLVGVVSPFAKHAGERASLFARVHVPAAVLVQDCLVHRALLEGAWKGRELRHEVFSELGIGGLFPLNRATKSHLLRPRTVEPAGSAALAAPHPDLPDRVDMLRRLAPAHTGGCPLHDFLLFSVVLEYPPVPSTSVLSLELPVAAESPT